MRYLKKIAVNHQGLWLANNRTLLSNSTLKRGFINPILRYNRGPLTISLVKHNHSINDNHEPARPSSCFHSGYKQFQTKFLQFGVIYHGGPIFKEIQNSCIQCEMTKNKPFKVKMGPFMKCMFDKLQLFNFTSVAL